jgi:hypothetical protein
MTFSSKSRWARRAKERLKGDQDNFNIQLLMDLRPGRPVLTNGPVADRTRIGAQTRPNRGNRRSCGIIVKRGIGRRRVCVGNELVLEAYS